MTTTQREANERAQCSHVWSDFGQLGGRNVSWCPRCDTLAWTGNEPEVPAATDQPSATCRNCDDQGFAGGGCAYCGRMDPVREYADQPSATEGWQEQFDARFTPTAPQAESHQTTVKDALRRCGADTDYHGKMLFSVAQFDHFVSMIRPTAPQAATKANTPHTCAAFSASYYDEHRRQPSGQECFDAGMRACRDITWPDKPTTASEERMAAPVAKEVPAAPEAPASEQQVRAGCASCDEGWVYKPCQLCSTSAESQQNAAHTEYVEYVNQCAEQGRKPMKFSAFSNFGFKAADFQSAICQHTGDKKWVRPIAGIPSVRRLKTT